MLYTYPENLNITKATKNKILLCITQTHEYRNIWRTRY